MLYNHLLAIKLTDSKVQEYNMMSNQLMSNRIRWPQDE